MTTTPESPTKKKLKKRLIAFLDEGAEREADSATARNEGISRREARRRRELRRKWGHEAFDEDS